MNALEKAEQLKNELDNLRPLDAEAEARILQKFRLDWNYHSNNIEGNSLTYGETKALILFGITAQGKPLKDHFEITGHNEAINWILELVKEDVPLTEKFIRELHVLLLKEDHYVDAITIDGQSTRKLVKVGSYKTSPNHVKTVTGEIFYFATPEETPAKMQELIEWFRKEKEKADANPIILAAVFHYRFIRIHPFDDGNGRVARILMNFILMQFGYPPVIIKTEDKENYYAVLRLADAGELERFIEYITENLIRSLEIMIRGAKGEDIEEPDDLDKELALLDRKLEFIGEKAEIKLNGEIFRIFLENIVLPLANNFFDICEKFRRFYTSVDYLIIANPSHFVGTDYSLIKEIKFKSSKISYEELSNELLEEFYHSTGERKICEIGIECRFNSLNRIIDKEISYVSRISIILYDRYFSILNDEGKTLLQKGYKSLISENEMRRLLRQFIDYHKDFINSEVEKIAEKKNN